MSEGIGEHLAVSANWLAPNSWASVTQKIDYSLNISPGAVINFETGAVTIPDGLSPDDAARAFWAAVSSHSPGRRA